MKWFQHDSNANTDAKLRRLRLKYGMEGYGLYWYCLELVAQNVSRRNLTFELEHDSEIIAHDTGIHFERVQEMMQYMVSLRLFESNNGAITCFKMALRLDETTAKNPQFRDLQEKVRLGSTLSPDSLPTESGNVRARTEENRTEQNTTEQRTTLSGSSPDASASATNKKSSHLPTARAVLSFLNEKTGRNYQPVKANIDMITARLKEGATERQCRLVILRKFHDWGNDEKMAEYLRPATLFNRTKFAQYVGEIPKEENSGRV